MYILAVVTLDGRDMEMISSYKYLGMLMEDVLNYWDEYE